jgi:uncharacterized membrane protein
MRYAGTVFLSAVCALFVVGFMIVVFWPYWFGCLLHEAGRSPWHCQNAQLIWFGTFVVSFITAYQIIIRWKKDDH